MEIEICCGSIQSAANAKAGGAVRVELCQGLVEGGTTPSPATIQYAVRELGLKVFVLVRPRGGDFCYNELEVKTMEEDVAFCKEAGASGIVVGFLHPDGSIDTELTRRFVELSAPLPVTFHRAFDECADPLNALEQIIECGCARVLTSGCKPTAMGDGYGRGTETDLAIVRRRVRREIFFVFLHRCFVERQATVFY